MPDRRPLVVDVETTSFKKGNPFAQRNKLCVIGLYDGVQFNAIPIEYEAGFPYGPNCTKCNSILAQYNLLVAFNAKFDLHWLVRYGILPNELLRSLDVFDCQLAEFLLGNQAERMPALDNVVSRRGIGRKSDVLERYYADGLDTTDIPYDELVGYLEQDCKLEWALYQQQVAELKEQPFNKLFQNSCKDLLILLEMEENGLLFDFDLCRKIGDEKSQRIVEIDGELDGLYGSHIPNWNSGSWISAVLYGGTIQVKEKHAFVFTYKDGHTAEKERWAEVERKYPRMVDPLPRSEIKRVAKNGDKFFKTDEDTLRKLHARGKTKRLVELLLERAKLDKAVSTYFEGFPKLHEEMDWEDNVIHGQLQQTVAVTGRLASSRPNQQNIDPALRQCIRSRF